MLAGIGEQLGELLHGLLAQIVVGGGEVLQRHGAVVAAYDAAGVDVECLLVVFQRTVPVGVVGHGVAMAYEVAFVAV